MHGIWIYVSCLKITDCQILLRSAINFIYLLGKPYLSGLKKVVVPDEFHSKFLFYLISQINVKNIKRLKIISYFWGRVDCSILSGMLSHSSNEEALHKKNGVVKQLRGSVNQPCLSDGCRIFTMLYLY